MVSAMPEEVDYIHNMYLELARTGKATEEQHRNFTSLAHTLLSRDGVDPIVLAGTDFTRLFDDTNAGFPHVDCAAFDLAAILKVAGRDFSEYKPVAQTDNEKIGIFLPPNPLSDRVVRASKLLRF